VKHHSVFQTIYYTCICFLFFSFFSGCQQQDALYQRQLYVFGTFVEMTFWDVPESLAQKSANLIASDLQKMHRDWHAWQPSSLTALNHAIAVGQPYLIEDDELLFMLKQAKQWSQQSEGLFNPAIGQLINLWGFQRDDLTISHPPPSAQAIAERLALNPTMADLNIEGQKISSRNRAVQLDLGAIAKGYALDLVIKRLQTLNIQNAIVNAGGNLKAIGSKGNKPWTIGIRHPSGQGILAVLKAHGEESVVTSGDYERFYEYQGIRYAHIIDPRTGKPAQGLTSVTVIHASGAFADATATALIVAGIEKWSQIAQQMGLIYVMVVDNAGTVYLSPAMAERVQFVTDEQFKQIVVDWH
jgi:thiamine biosynthesis lipoprotein